MSHAQPRGWWHDAGRRLFLRGHGAQREVPGGTGAGQRRGVLSHRPGRRERGSRREGLWPMQCHAVSTRLPGGRMRFALRTFGCHGKLFRIWRKLLIRRGPTCEVVTCEVRTCFLFRKTSHLWAARGKSWKSLIQASFGPIKADQGKTRFGKLFGCVRRDQEDGAHGGGRTHNLWLRRPTLYPIELRAQRRRIMRFPDIGASSYLGGAVEKKENGAPARTRTLDQLIKSRDTGGCGW